MFTFQLFYIFIKKGYLTFDLLVLGFKENEYRWRLFRFNRTKWNLELCLFGLHLVKYKKNA